VQSGKLKVLGVSKRTRMPLIADVPTIAEQGVANFESGTWQGMLVARGTPEPVVRKLHAALVQVIRSPEVRSRLSGQGAEVVTMEPAEQDRFFETERKRWAQVVAAANIKLD
jgi:tripartite-type tricarboxylate transporter receptor subunit TctC